MRIVLIEDRDFLLWNASCQSSSGLLIVDGSGSSEMERALSSANGSPPARVGTRGQRLTGSRKPRAWLATYVAAGRAARATNLASEVLRASAPASIELIEG